MCSAGTPARCTASAITSAAKSSGRQPESAPLRRPTGVRALETDEGVLFFDPVAIPEELKSRGKAVVLTAAWHGREAQALGLPICGDDLPKDVTAQPAFFPGERTLWIPAQNALIAGDSLPNGSAIPDAWLESDWAKGTREDYNAKLAPLCDLPIELLLTT